MTAPSAPGTSSAVTAVVEQGWLRDTMARVSLRYGRALHALSLLPGPITLTWLADSPDDADVQRAAQAIDVQVREAIAELERIRAYVAVTDPADRPDWQKADTDLTTDQQTSQQVGGPPAAPAAKQARRGSLLRREH